MVTNCVISIAQVRTTPGNKCAHLASHPHTWFCYLKFRPQDLVTRSTCSMRAKLSGRVADSMDEDEAITRCMLRVNVF
jgi:hypothetical protein